MGSRPPASGTFGVKCGLWNKTYKTKSRQSNRLSPRSQIVRHRDIASVSQRTRTLASPPKHNLLPEPLHGIMYGVVVTIVFQNMVWKLR
jgi:hypothetical protein